MTFITALRTAATVNVLFVLAMMFAFVANFGTLDPAQLSESAGAATSSQLALTGEAVGAKLSDLWTQGTAMLHAPDRFADSLTSGAAPAAESAK